MIFSLIRKEHVRHVEIVLKKLAYYGLRLTIRKCYFGVKKVDFLGVTVSDRGLSITKVQKQKALKIKPPKNAKDQKSIIGFEGSLKKLFLILVN